MTINVQQDTTGVDIVLFKLGNRLETMGWRYNNN